MKTRKNIGIAKVHHTNVYFFCGEIRGKDVLHDASTPGMNTRVRNTATFLQDRALLVKLGTTDLMAQNAQYQAKCLAALYNRERHVREYSAGGETKEAESKALALAELVTFIEEVRGPESRPVFHLADLLKMYSPRLSQMDVVMDVRPNSTRLKRR